MLTLNSAPQPVVMEEVMRTQMMPWNFFAGERYLDFIRRKQLGSAIVRDIANIQAASAREITRAISDQTKAILLGSEAVARRAERAVFNGHRIEVYSRPPTEQEFGLLLGYFKNSLTGIATGVADLSSGLDRLSGQLDGLNSTFQWGFEEILGSLGKIADDISGIRTAVENPSKSAAFEKFNDAREAFKNRWYEEALELVEAAINGDDHASGYKLEWRFHRLKGIILLGSASIPTSLIDLPEAERSFLFAARYSSPWPVTSGVSLLAAGWAAYAQDEIGTARTYTNQAIAILNAKNPSPKGVLGEAKFQAAKFAMPHEDVEEGLSHLSEAIDIDCGYIIKADTDPDFLPYRNELLELFESKRQEILSRIRKIQREME